MRRKFFRASLLMVTYLKLTSSTLCASECPAGYVVGSTSCVPLNLCPNGAVMLGPDCGTTRETTPAVRPPKTINPPSRDTCEEVIEKNRNRGFRRVLFVNGNLNDLLGEYTRTAELKRIEVRLDQLEVIYFSNPQKPEVLRWGRDVKLSLGELVRGRLPEFAWQKALGDKRAIPIDRPNTVAKEYDADLICGKLR